MAQFALPKRPRPPALRIALIAAMVGASVGLLRVSERRAPPALPAAPDSVDDEVLAADLRYRFALFAWDLAVRTGVPGTTSPSAWEEEAVAEYERLALRPAPDPAACHRLGIIYARRGYLRQGREMLTRAVTRDEGAADVYWALMLVYSEEPLEARNIGGMRECLLRQPRWLAMWSMADLADRVNLPRLSDHYEAEALGALRRFGWLVCLLAGTLGSIVAVALIAVLIAGLRAFLARERRQAVWLAALPPLGWLDVLDVVALAMLGNALGQVGRDAIAPSVAPGSVEDTGLRACHALVAFGPPLILAIVRARRGRFAWWRALGLVSVRLHRHLFQGLVGLGVALAAAIVVRDLLLAGLQIIVPGLPAAALSARALPGREGLSIATEMALVVALAPLLEEVIFRGFIFRSLLDRLRPIAAAGLSAILFAAAHLAWDPQAFLSLFCLGLVSAYVYQYSRSLIPSILLHAGYNAAILAAAFLLRA